MKHLKYIIAAVILILTSHTATAMECGAERLDCYVPLLENRRVGLVVNQSSRIDQRHLLDTLLSSNIDVRKIYTPEHGFRGDADAGEHVKDGCDISSGVPIISLYGSNRKPTAENLEDIDVLLFDIQDVGARFYTYISTLYYVMQSATEHNIEVIVLDRPNPNDYIDGPILKPDLKSFVGVLPIPILHGLTMGELAKMINGEGWIEEGKCPLKVIPMEGWQHQQPYSLPIKPSPNLPNDQSIALYPSLCFFEATDVSVGRGTIFPFQVIGYPDPKFGDFTFTPRPLVGSDKDPLQNGKRCYGLDLRDIEAPKGLSLSYFINFMRLSSKGDEFITRPSFFDLLMGDKRVREMIVEGKSESEIRDMWSEELATYSKMRIKYLIYDDQRIKNNL